jgi:tetratricopeptide (TPR) repeat protein
MQQRRPHKSSTSDLKFGVAHMLSCQRRRHGSHEAAIEALRKTYALQKCFWAYRAYGRAEITPKYNSTTAGREVQMRISARQLSHSPNRCEKMKAIFRIVFVWCFVVGAAASAGAARESDIAAIDRQINDLVAAGNYSVALVKAQKLEAIVKARFGVDSLFYSLALFDLARVKEAQGNHAEAEDLYQRALEIREKTLGPSNPYVADTLNNLAMVYESRGEYAEALDLYQRVLTIREKALGPSHPDVARALGNLANVYFSQGKYAEAVEFHRHALAIFEKALGPTHPDVAQTLNNLGNVYFEQGNYAEAVEFQKRALEIRKKHLARLISMWP